MWPNKGCLSSKKTDHKSDEFNIAQSRSIPSEDTDVCCFDRLTGWCVSHIPYFEDSPQTCTTRSFLNPCFKETLCYACSTSISQTLNRYEFYLQRNADSYIEFLIHNDHSSDWISWNEAPNLTQYEYLLIHAPSWIRMTFKKKRLKMTTLKLKRRVNLHLCEAFPLLDNSRHETFPRQRALAKYHKPTLYDFANPKPLVCQALTHHLQILPLLGEEIGGAFHRFLPLRRRIFWFRRWN